MQKFVITWAQNNTQPCMPFVRALEQYCHEESAKILVVRGYYRNPSSPSEKEEGLWWDVPDQCEVVDTDIQLCPNLRLYASLRCQPTATHPLTGLNVFLGKNSGIIGHPKRALETVPTATRTPRIAVTTSACTVSNYSHSKAGAKGAENHVIGALIVEVDDDGIYHLRHITWNEEAEEFTDLDRTYFARGSRPAKSPLAIVLGDIHVGKEDWSVIRATRALCQKLRPDHLVLHDVLDFDTRNHHKRGMRAKFDAFDMLVKNEVKTAARALTRIARTWGAKQVDIVRSNHDEAFERWLDDTEPYEDPANAPYYHAVWSRTFEYYAEHGSWPNLFEMESRLCGVPESVRFLKRNESLKLADVELAMHGDKGLGGGRASLMQYVKLGCKSVTAHGHAPFWIDGAVRVGVTARLDHGYNFLPSAWAHAHAILHADGRRQLIFINSGRYRGVRATVSK